MIHGVEAAETAPGRRTVSRRAFACGAAGAAAAVMVHSSVAAAEETRELRLGVIGCGGRGSGAINDSLSINDGVRLVATADLYAPKCAALWKALRQAHPDKVAATETISRSQLPSTNSNTSAICASVTVGENSVISQAQ